MAMEPVFTVEEVAIMLNKDKRIIYQWLATGTLQGRRKSKGRKSRWEIPASTVKSFIPGKLSEIDKAVLDISAKILELKERPISESGRVLLDELLMHFLSLQNENYSNATEEEEQKKNRCHRIGITTSDCIGWDKLALHQLISMNQHRLVSDAALSEILISNEWVAAYEYLTNEIVFVRDAELKADRDEEYAHRMEG
ncbi:hypothetical protein [Paenibacillus montanisoli]|uniref:Helix-turn-helix domain-containing protein n=1 Tax=Paenibacillus montanisoli TaxID=2081970 RepID=A0A328U2P8_9BACL|nr:hypothetical protein [Paenibacillus montanisoli]RAP76980.1 hypothetical protein DL346_00270 [Paenibacillus montanisoli]